MRTPPVARSALRVHQSFCCLTACESFAALQLVKTPPVPRSGLRVHHFFAALQLVKEEEEGEGRYGPFHVTQELVYNVVEQMQETACKLKSGTK